MNKELIERLALEVADRLNLMRTEGRSWPNRDKAIDDYAIRFATIFLPAVDAERGKDKPVAAQEPVCVITDGLWKWDDSLLPIINGKLYSNAAPCHRCDENIDALLSIHYGAEGRLKAKITEQAAEIERLNKSWKPVCDRLTGTDNLAIESPVDYVEELFNKITEQAAFIKQIADTCAEAERINKP